MDIILINTIGIAIGIGLIVGLMLIISYQLYRRKKISKFNLLKIKQCGGVDLTDTEQKFLVKNAHMYTGRIAWGMFNRRRFTLKKIKQQTKTFFLKLNPFYKRNKQISDLKSKVEQYKSNVDYYKTRCRHVTHDIDEISAELKELKNPTKKPTVPEFIETAQNYDKSSLTPFSNIKTTSRFV